MSFSPIGGELIPVYQPLIPSSSFNLNDMLAKAQVYAKEWKDCGEDNIFNCIQTILNDPKFQRDPISFLAALKKERGDFDTLYMPEDPAICFLEENFKPIN